MSRTWRAAESYSGLGSLGLGLTRTRATPLVSDGSRIDVRESTTLLRPTLRAEFGFELSLSCFLLAAGPSLEIHFKRTHYDVLQEGQRIRAVTPWLIVPGVQLTVSYRQPAPTMHQGANSGVRSRRR